MLWLQINLAFILFILLLLPSSSMSFSSSSAECNKQTYSSIRRKKSNAFPYLACSPKVWSKLQKSQICTMKVKSSQLAGTCRRWCATKMNHILLLICKYPHRKFSRKLTTQVWIGGAYCAYTRLAIKLIFYFPSHRHWIRARAQNCVYAKQHDRKECWRDTCKLN